MSDLPQVMASPIEMTLNGKKYKLSPLSLGDMADFEAWVISQRIEAVLNYAGPLTPTERAQVISEIYNNSNQVVISQEMGTMKGMLHLFWCSMKKHQPEITKEDVSNLVSLDNLDKMSALIDVISYPEVESEDGEEDNKDEDPFPKDSEPSKP